MATCNKCGAQIPDNSFTCPSCGASTVSVEGQDYTNQFETNDIEQNKVMAVLAYIGILFLVPLLAAPQSKFARFHANQGLILFIVEAILGVIAGACIFIPIAGKIIAGVLGLAIFVLIILGIVNAASGKGKELPLIGKFRIIK